MRKERRKFDREAKEKGRMARLGGTADKVSDNPYPVGTRQSESFSVGWDEANSNIEKGIEAPFSWLDE